MGASFNKKSDRKIGKSIESINARVSFFDDLAGAGCAMLLRERAMEEGLFYFLFWPAVAGVLSAPIVWLGRKRVCWRGCELLALVLPYVVWSALMCSPLETGRKSLANLGEPVYFAVAVPIAAIVRVALGQKISERICAGVLIVLMCIAAGLVFFTVPMLPE